MDNVDTHRDDEELNETPEEAAPSESKEMDPPIALPTRLHIEELERKVAEYDAKISDIRDYVRKMEAEIADIRSRSTREVSRAVDAKVISFLRDLLPTLDNFELALKADEPQQGPLADGLRMIAQQFSEFLKNAGLVRVESVGQKFDPHVHEAIVTKPVENPEEDGMILQEFKAGYKFKETVVRPAQVMVGST